MKSNFVAGKRTRLGAAGIVLALLGFATASHAQYTDQQAMTDLGGPKEFARRRTELAKQAKTGYVLLFANTHLPEAAHYREDNDFYYFTGIADPGAVLLMDAEKGFAVIFEPQQEKRTAQVYGPNLLSLPKDEQAKLGFETVRPLTQFQGALVYFLSTHSDTDLWVRLNAPDKADGARLEVAREYVERDAMPWHPDAYESQAPARWLAAKFPAARLRDVTPLIDGMRNIKTPQEIEVLRRNGKLSAEGDREAIAHALPGMYQYQIEATAYDYFYSHGAQGVAYPAIVGSGSDINTWHYFSNRHQIQPNELVVFDYAASLDQITMDITRTFNISGKFTPEQAKWYAVDLECQKAVIAMLTFGHTYDQADAAGKAVFAKAGIADQWLGFPGHFVGMATHDVSTNGIRPAGPIQTGQVVTVEPIVEFPDKHMHYRVEDTILITAGAPELLSAGVPKEMAEIENLVGSENHK
jgi:Xaa-Pro aminopeptidase